MLQPPPSQPGQQPPPLPQPVLHLPPRALLSSSVLQALGLNASLFDDPPGASAGDSSSSQEFVNGHAEPVTCCAWVSSEGSAGAVEESPTTSNGTLGQVDDSAPMIVTGSADRRIILWDLSGEVLDVWSGDMISDIVVVGSRMLAATPHNKCVLFRIHKRRIEEM
jgi:hypothetical protein